MTCLACNGSTNLQSVGPVKDAIVCTRCGFISANSVDNSSSPELYDEQWSKLERHPTYEFSNGQYVIRNRWKLQQLLHRLTKFRKLNRILDVGCSAAFFLKLAQENGWEAQGVEVTEWAAKFSSEKLGVPVYNGYLEDAHFPDEHFDVAVSSHVIEHIQDPKALICEMRRVLRPGGAFVATVPTQFRAPSYVFFKDFYGEPPPRHVSFFSRRSMEALLRSNGFTIHRSLMNIELQIVLEHLKLKQPERKKTRPETSEASGSANGAPSIPIRAVKGIVNRVGTVLDIGDEICTIAVRN